MRWAIALAILLLIGCTKPAEEQRKSSNPDVLVDKLFEIDGCTIYRFQDHGLARYFSRCVNGYSRTFWADPQYCGKNCTTYVSQEM